MPEDSSAAVNSVVSAWLARESSQHRSDASGAGVWVVIAVIIVRPREYLRAEDLEWSQGTAGFEYR